MAGFEIVVRPVIIPNIRPAPTRSLPPEDDEKDRVIINGQGGGTFVSSESRSFSATDSGGKETQREFDEVRIRPKGGGGEVGAGRSGARAEDTTSSDVYVDVEVVKKIWLKSEGKKFVRNYAEVQLEDNMEMLRTNVRRDNK